LLDVDAAKVGVAIFAIHAAIAALAFSLIGAGYEQERENR
jgi:hypothetical protein